MLVNQNRKPNRWLNGYKKIISVDNRKQVLIEIVHLLSLLFFFTIILIQVNQKQIINYIILILTISFLVFAVVNLRFQNIRHGCIHNDLIILNYRNKTVEIPVKKIKEIKKGNVMNLNLTGKMTYIFILYLDKGFVFRNKIYLRYLSSDNLIMDEPEEIQYLRSKIIG